MLEGQCIRNVGHDPYTGLYYENAVQSYSCNNARVLLEYLRNPAFGVNLSESEIHYESFYQAIQICDRIVQRDVAKKGVFWNYRGGQKDLHLFECHLSIDPSKPFRENIEKILGTMYMADLIWSEGQYKLQFKYPRLYDVTATYNAGEIVQTTTGGRMRLLRAATQTTRATSLWRTLGGGLRTYWLLKSQMTTCCKMARSKSSGRP